MSDIEERPAVRQHPIYRAQAVEAMESHDELERLLPVTTWRGWLVAVAALLLLLAAVLYASSNVREVTVTGSGRVADNQGVRLVTATVAGQFADYHAHAGEHVERGDLVAEIVSGDRVVPQRAQSAGTIVGGLVRPGDPITVGQWLLELSSRATTGRQVLVAFSVEDGQRLSPGQSADVTVVGSPTLPDARGRIVQGTVLEGTVPLPQDQIALGLALQTPPEGPQIVAVIKLAEPVEPGSAVTATVLVSERNLLQQMLGSS